MPGNREHPFQNPRELMAWLGLVPSEASTGDRIRRFGITKAGNGRARRALIEAAWCYRFPARIGQASTRHGADPTPTKEG